MIYVWSFATVCAYVFGAYEFGAHETTGLVLMGGAVASSLGIAARGLWEHLP